MRLSSLLLVPALVCGVLAQQGSQSSSQGSSSTSLSLSASASPTPSQSAAGSAVVATRIFTTTLSRGQPRPSDAPASGSVYATYALYITTLAPSSSVVASSTAAAAAAASPTHTHDASADGLPLHTRIDGAFGVLGVLLISSGLALALWGPSVRWLFCFISGAYWLALACISLVFKLGVERAIFDPSDTTRGLFLLAAALAGILGGILCIFWWTGASLLAAGIGGFALGTFSQACKADGLIAPLGLRWILYIACTVAFAALSCWRRVQTPVHIVSAALAGSTALVLGIDCFSTAGLKEFYARNILGNWLFEDRHVPTFSDGRFPLVTVIQIELGVIGGCTILSLALQSKMFTELRKNLRALRSDDEERRTQSRAKRAAKTIFKNAQRDLREWEIRHGYRSAGEVRNRDAHDVDATLVARPQAFKRDSTMSLLPLHARESRSRNDSVATTFLEKQPISAPFSEDIAIAFPSPPKSADGSSAVVDTTHATPEQAALMEEIAEIRRSITLLRSSRPSSMVIDALPAPAPSSDGMARTESTGSSSERHASKPAPWITSDRSPRARATSRGMSMDLASIPDELLPPVPASHAVDMPGAEQAHARTRTSSSAELETKRPFSTHSVSSPLQLPDATAAPATHGRSRRLSRTLSNGAPQSPPLEASSRRVIVDTPEAAAARYAKALNRNSTVSARDTPRQSGGASAGLTLAELEERHRAQMAKMQSPTAEAFKVALAKEEHEKRMAAERRAMEAKERARQQQLEQQRQQQEQQQRHQQQQQRRQSSTPNQPPTSPDAGMAHSRSRSLSIDMLQRASEAPSVGQKRASGAQRAAQWRNSLAEVPAPPLMARDGSRSPQMQPTVTGGGSMGRRGSTSMAQMAGASYFATQGASMGRSYSTSPSGLMGGKELSRVFEGGAEAHASTTPAGASAQRTSSSPRKPLTDADRRRISEGALGPRNSLLQQQVSPGGGGLLRFGFDEVAAQAWQAHVALQQQQQQQQQMQRTPTSPRRSRPSSGYFA